MDRTTKSEFLTVWFPRTRFLGEAESSGPFAGSGRMPWGVPGRLGVALVPADEVYISVRLSLRI